MTIIAFTLLTVCIVIYLLYIYKKFNKSFPFLIIFLVYVFWGMYSIIYIDNGTYISEQKINSYFTGASIKLILILLPLLITTPIFFKRLYKRETKKENKESNEEKLNFINYKTIKYIQIFSIAVLLYLYINLIISGIPLFDGKKITNFNFYEKYSKLPLASKIQSFFLMFNLVLNGIILSDSKFNKRNKIIAIVIYILSIGFRVLCNEKFYPFFVYTVYFFIPTIMKYFSKERDIKEERKFLLKIGSIAVTTFFIFVGIVMIKYNIRRTTNPWDRFRNRAFSLQAHLFWGYDNYLERNDKTGINFENIKNEIVGGIGKTSKFDKNIGVTKIMYLVSPKGLVDGYMKNMTRFYSGYWTVCIGCYGYFGTSLYSVFVGLLIAFYSVKFAKAIESKNFIKIFITSSTYYVIFQYFNEANYSYLFSIRMLIFTLILVNEDFFEKKFNQIAGYIKKIIEEKNKAKVN